MFYFSDEHKTKEDVEVEGSIIKEMMDIVAKRDSLIALLEEDRLRCFFKSRCFLTDLFFPPPMKSSHNGYHISIILSLACLLVLAYLVLVVLLDVCFNHYL